MKQKRQRKRERNSEWSTGPEGPKVNQCDYDDHIQGQLCLLQQNKGRVASHWTLEEDVLHFHENWKMLTLLSVLIKVPRIVHSVSYTQQQTEYREVWRGTLGTLHFPLTLLRSKILANGNFWQMKLLWATSYSSNKYNANIPWDTFPIPPHPQPSIKIAEFLFWNSGYVSEGTARAILEKRAWGTSPSALVFSTLGFLRSPGNMNACLGDQGFDPSSSVFVEWSAKPK